MPPKGVISFLFNLKFDVYLMFMLSFWKLNFNAAEQIVISVLADN